MYLKRPIQTRYGVISSTMSSTFRSSRVGGLPTAQRPTSNRLSLVETIHGVNDQKAATVHNDWKIAYR